MTKQNKNRKEKATLEEMVKSGSQLVLMRDDGSEQPIEEMIEAPASSQEDSDDTEFHYKSWWNQFRGPWLQSEKMTEEEIRIKADDAWECGDYKEMINLMAELICRLEKK
ncbi:MAG: hypothetical protein K0B87_06635 [Candidatus Syntrophosphaera sp.]|nr:hypothetical protein [Candidatus Syntrophosphaera sp.]